MAEAIKLFSKSLTKTDTKKRLAIPAKILADLPDFNGSHAIDLNLFYGTKRWPIVCSVRKNGYKKPVFSGGWKNFVLCNNLRVGDELSLYKVLDETGSSYFRVEVVKPAAETCRDLEHEQELPTFVEDDTVKVDQQVDPKPPCWLFGANLSDEATRLKTETEISGIDMTKAEKEKIFGAAEWGEMAYCTKAAGAA